MSRFKEFKQKIKENKYKIIAGTITIAGVVYILVKQNEKINVLTQVNEKQNNTINDLIIQNDRQQEDIGVLKHVMNGTVLASLKETVTRKLRYREGKLNNALKNDNNLAEIDITKLREEIAYYSGELEKIFEAEELLNNER